MLQQDPSVRFIVRACRPGVPTPESIATDLNRLHEALSTGTGELVLEAQDGDASPRLMGTWRDSPVDSSTVPGVVYDYSAQLTGKTPGSNLTFPRVETYFTRDQWLAAVRTAAHKYIEASTPARRIR